MPWRSKPDNGLIFRKTRPPKISTSPFCSTQGPMPEKICHRWLKKMSKMPLVMEQERLTSAETGFIPQDIRIKKKIKKIRFIIHFMIKINPTAVIVNLENSFDLILVLAPWGFYSPICWKRPGSFLCFFFPFQPCNLLMLTNHPGWAHLVVIFCNLLIFLHTWLLIDVTVDISQIWLWFPTWRCWAMASRAPDGPVE